MANVTLGNRYESYVKELVETGRYSSVSEVVRSSLRLLEEDEKIRAFRLERLREEIQRGVDSGSAGRLDISDIKSKGSDRLQALQGSLEMTCNV